MRRAAYTRVEAARLAFLRSPELTDWCVYATLDFMLNNVRRYLAASGWAFSNRSIA